MSQIEHGMHASHRPPPVPVDDGLVVAATPPSAPVLRQSKSHSTLADSIRALRETANTSNRPNSPQAPAPSGLGNRRKRPSPLQQAEPLSPKLYGRETNLYSPLSPSFTPISLPDGGPRSPRERLEALFASTYSTTASSSPQDGVFSSTTAAPSPALSKSSAREAPSHGQVRNISAPILPSSPTLGFSPPTSPTNMLPSRPDPRPVMARTASIDSAVSSISSSASQSTRSTPAPGPRASQDTITSPVADIAGLVAAAGSVEAALQKLWKEKQSADSHNAQLWRLVEKQRAMILGLNRDLERAVKDKDRYRHKLKDLSQHTSAAVFQRPDSVLSREQSQSPAPAEEHLIAAKSSSGQRHPPVVPSTIPEATVPEHVAQETKANSIQTPTSDSASAVESNGDLTSMESSPVVGTSTRAESAQDRSETPASFVDQDERPLKAPIATPTKIAAHARAPALAPLSPPQSPPQQHLTPPGPPTLALTQATPVTDSGSFSPKSRQIHRKPAPAPLNLTQPTRSAPEIPVFDDSPVGTPTRTATEQNNPRLDRGRRKTREEDDRLREEIAVAQEAARSVSKKSKKSKSKTPKEHPQIVEPAESTPSTLSSQSVQGLPPSPRLAQGPVSLSSLLSPAGSDSSISSTTVHRSNITTPLLSPGLPMSPRPGDRPVNAPTPRMPKQAIPNPPLSPRIAYGPAPTSPRKSPSAVIPTPPTAQAPLQAPAQQKTQMQAQAQGQGMGFSVLSPSAVPPPLFMKKQQQNVPTMEHQQSNENTKSDTDHLTPTSGRPSTGSSESPGAEVVYRGLISDQYPGLLLPPNALPFIDVKAASSRLRPSRHSILIGNPNEDDPVFLLGIYARSDGKQLWRVEKTIMALPVLHQQIKSLCAFDARLPEKSIFSGHAPAKIDARRNALNAYFNLLLDTQLTEKAAVVVCNFFSTNVMGVEGAENLVLPSAISSGGAAPLVDSNEPPRKEGYLTKRGKNFGGWKARFFVLDGPELRYYDSPGGPQIGTIKLIKAQIGKQSPQQSNHSPGEKDDDAEHQYRHAFLILEPKKRDSASLVRHVLCAESDDERDAWVKALMAYVNFQDERPEKAHVHVPALAPPPLVHSESARSVVSMQSPPQVQTYQPQGYRETPTREAPRPPTRQIESPEPPSDEPLEPVQGMSYEETVAGETPIRGTTVSTYRNTQSTQPSRTVPSPPLNGNFSGLTAFQGGKDRSFLISAPSNATVIQDAGMWGNKTPAKDKKRSIFGFRGRSSSDTNQSQTNIVQPEQQRRHAGRPIFGMPLAEAVEASQPVGIDVHLPAVVYRCIEYLEAREAIEEEGIFRLSGSQNVIKALRERFNNEIDVKLLDGDYFDVHAVASLLKLYLRELPSSVLTRELHLDFLKVLDVEDKDKRVAGFNVLVHKLPRANAELLSNLCSYLADIANRSDVNKMNVRNGKFRACK
jgi:RalA-binding protein 1